MKIYTKTGDNGTTGLFGSEMKRVKKYDIRVETYGTVDELNSFVGIITSSLDNIFTNVKTKELLMTIQKRLFNISSQLAMDNSEFSKNIKNTLKINEIDIELLEKEIDRMNEKLPELKDFILPVSNNISASYTHVARTVCRRCERRMVELNEISEIDSNSMIFINRLSDYFFVLARYLSYQTNSEEYKWK